MIILHYGLQRSGTNLLETLMNNNYEERFWNPPITSNSNESRKSPLQKHFRLYYNGEGFIPHDKYKHNFKIDTFEDWEKLLQINPDYYLIVSKDPYSWLLSYTSYVREVRQWARVSHHYIMEYNLFYGKWLEFSQQTSKIIFIRYIDLLKNPAQELEKLEIQIGLTKKNSMPVEDNLIEEIPQSKKFSQDRRSYYLDEKYLDNYSQKDLHELNTLIDSKVISGLGYEMKENIISEREETLWNTTYVF